jgi:hypothetical protein
MVEQEKNLIEIRACHRAFKAAWEELSTSSPDTAIYDEQALGIVNRHLDQLMICIGDDDLDAYRIRFENRNDFITVRVFRQKLASLTGYLEAKYSIDNSIPSTSPTAPPTSLPNFTVNNFNIQSLQYQIVNDYLNHLDAKANKLPKDSEERKLWEEKIKPVIAPARDLTDFISKFVGLIPLFQNSLRSFCSIFS